MVATEPLIVCRSRGTRSMETRVTESILCDLGFDVAGWCSTAGLKRNEADAPPPRKKAKRRAKQAPVQLSFAFI